MKNKDPAILFYTSDFLTGTMFMSDEEVGIYIRLICAQHQHGGLIPVDVFEAKTANRPLVSGKFVHTDEGYYNVRLMSEMAKRAKKSCNMSANASKRWEKSKQLECNCTAIVMQPEDENENKDAVALAVGGRGVGEGAETWKTSYPLYKSEHDAVYARLSVDLQWLAEQERLNPGINAELSLEKAARFWGREEGWLHKKRKRTAKLNWATTYENALSMPGNKVYRPRTNEKPGQVVEDNHYRQAN